MNKPKNYFNETEQHVIDHFKAMGVTIYKPTEHKSNVDFVADFNGKSHRIKVKHSKTAHNGLIRFDINSTKRHKNIQETNLEKEVDFYACYSYVRNQVYLVPVEKAPMTDISIRFEDTKIHSKRIRNEKDFSLDKVISFTN